MDQQPRTIRVADIVAGTLHAHGVRSAFGIPGGETVTLVDALQVAGIAFHLARHETSAAVMAAGASTISTNPEVLVTTVGPGLANAVNGIADAMQERIPLIVLSAIVDRGTRARYTHQVIDHAQLLRPLVKASFEIEPESAAATVARAIALAATDPMGPVHLDISPAVAAAPSTNSKILPRPAKLSPSVSITDSTAQMLSERIRAAKRPLILAGLEAVRSQSGAALQHLAETIGAPVITTYKAKGIIPEDHPLCLGAAGLSPLADRFLLPLAQKADLVLMFGYDPIEMRLGWMDFTTDSAKLIDVSNAYPDHAMHHAGTRISANPRSILQALNGSLIERAGWPDSEPHKTKLEISRAFSPKESWGPHVIIDLLRQAVGSDDLVTVDSGAHRILLSQKWIAAKPLTLLQSSGFCTMNAALPLAIGAKVADPSRRIFAVMGDGGLEMGIGELATVRDLGLPLTVVLFQDRSLALIALKQAAAGLSLAGVTLGETNFATVARGFGGFGVTVENANEFRNELAAAGNRRTFSLIACRFNADAYEGAF